VTKRTVPFATGWSYCLVDMDRIAGWKTGWGRIVDYCFVAECDYDLKKGGSR